MKEQGANMRFKIIGNGGAFNYLIPNSSFLIENQDKYLLFDCGYSVYAELRRQDEAGEIDLKKLDAVYISHMDDDHMGSLKTLLYYQYFIHGITTKVYAHAEVYDAVEDLLSKTNFKLEKGKFVHASITEVLDAEPLTTIIGLQVGYSNCSHHTTCYGLYLQQSSASALFISGDTKATPALAISIESLIKSNLSIKIFHDFSNWDCEGSQVHACKSDTERLYSPEVLDAITWYHNDAEFDGSWQTV